MPVNIQTFFSIPVRCIHNVIQFISNDTGLDANQQQTKDIFSDKWTSTNEIQDVEKLFETQREWFLKLYGFDTVENFQAYLQNKFLIVDTGCGLGYKAAWFAELAPHATVIGIDISEAAHIAAKNYAHLPNLWFLQADIAQTGLKPGCTELMVCDQVIMHTEHPEQTFRHLSECTSATGEFLCYFYRKKALPRELIDDYFRKRTHEVSPEDMWRFSEQLTELGKRLSELNTSFDCPEITLLGIPGGKYDIQRFIYWNFLKCFWKEDWGFELSKITNYDWYAPSNAQRFSKDEVLLLAQNNKMQASYFHEEEACYSGRFAFTHP